MELRFESFYKDGVRCWKLVVDDEKEFIKLLERLDQKYYDDTIDGYSFEPITITRVGNRIIKAARGVEAFDVTEEEIKTFVEKLRECKEELNKKEVLVFNI